MEKCDRIEVLMDVVICQYLLSRSPVAAGGRDFFILVSFSVRVQAAGCSFLESEDLRALCRPAL